MIHLIAALLELESPEGPKYILPSYGGIAFPEFPKKLAKVLRIKMSANAIKAEWDRILANPPDNYYGMPHAKLLILGHAREARAKWPIIGDGDKVKERIYRIRKAAQAGSLARLWAVGYEDGWICDSKIRLAVSETAANEEDPDPTPRKAKAKAKGKAKKASPVREVVVLSRKSYSRAPTDTEDDEGWCPQHLFSFTQANDSLSRTSQLCGTSPISLSGFSVTGIQR